MTDCPKIPHHEWPRDAVEALADAWASIDGKRDEFRAERGLDIEDQPGGRYDGYMFEAGEMIGRLRRRGYILTRGIPHEGLVR